MVLQEKDQETFPSSQEFKLDQLQPQVSPQHLN